MQPKAKIFTDGSSRGNPGPGGWATIISFDDRVVELGGYEKLTTNNRMELFSVIRGLEYIRHYKKETEIFTDSSYVLKGAKTWLSGWKKNGWKTQNKKEVLNKDLWEKIDKLLDVVKVSWSLVPGHSGIPANERCDEIATSFADKEETPLFTGSSSEYPVDLSISKSFGTGEERKTKNSGRAYSYISKVDGKIQIHKTWAECEERVKGKAGAKFRKTFSEENERLLKEEWSSPY